VDLLERDRELQGLDAALTEAAAGTGNVVLVHGEAGIGKTSLVRAFRRRVSGRAQAFVGACDDLLSPRALGPLRDAAPSGGTLAEALAGSDREAVYHAVLDLVSAPGPVMLLLEDVQWVDEATLDVVRLIGRRIANLSALLVLTYRDDELGSDHLVRLVLGGAPSRAPAASGEALPDSGGAVGRRHNGDLGPIVRGNGGNPFYVTEVVAAGQGSVPATVTDAVLARLGTLQPATVEALEQLAVVPSGTELPLGRTLMGDLSVLADAERAGMLEVHPGAVTFRHGLARRALDDALPASRRIVLHAAVLRSLLESEQLDLTRVVHHAVAASARPTSGR
jgi:hypothetical protein